MLNKEIKERAEEAILIGRAIYEGRLNILALEIINLLEDYDMLKPCSDEKTSIALCEIVEKLKTLA